MIRSAREKNKNDNRVNSVKVKPGFKCDTSNKPETRIIIWKSIRPSIDLKRGFKTRIT